MFSTRNPIEKDSDSDFEIIDHIPDNNSDFDTSESSEDSVVNVVMPLEKPEENKVSDVISESEKTDYELSETESETDFCARNDESFEKDHEPEKEIKIIITPPEEEKSEELTIENMDEEELPVLNVNFPFISNKYRGEYKVIYNFPFQNSPRVYIGQISNGKRNGMGTLYYDKEFKKGMFQENELLSGEYSGQGVTYSGDFDPTVSKLYGSNCRIYRQGFVFSGSVCHDAPLLEHGFVGFDKNMEVKFMGLSGKIAESKLFCDDTQNYMEGSLLVNFSSNRFIKRATIRICLYTNRPSKSGYESKFSDIIKFGNIVLANGSQINDYFVFLNTRKKGNVLKIICDLERVKNLFNNEKVIDTQYIHTEEKTLKMYQYTDNNCLLSMYLNPEIEWNNKELILWALINFPHFHVNFVKNLLKYKIDGKQLRYMCMNSNCDLVIERLFDDCSEYSLKYIRTDYDRLVLKVNEKQLVEKMMHSENGDSYDFYKEVLEKVPDMEEDFLRFIDTHKVSKRNYSTLSNKDICNIFNPIQIFQLNSQLI